MQGSALTLDKKAGNAFDTASLLIALLLGALSILASALAFDSNLGCEIAVSLAIGGLLSLLSGLIGEALKLADEAAAILSITTDVSGTIIDLDFLDLCDGFTN